MYRHAYSGYLKYAAGHDELRPLSNTAVNKCVYSLYIAGIPVTSPPQLQRLERLHV